MGNRAVITTKENFENDGIGIYVHWNGGRDSVQGFLTYCKLLNARDMASDCYGFATLTRVIANFFGGTTSIGIDKVSRLDCNNYDNGVYIVNNWEIVDRKYFDWEEQHAYPLEDMLIAIDEKQPNQLGEELLKSCAKQDKNISFGSIVFVYDPIYERYEKHIVKGKITKDKIVNGTNVNGLYYIDKYDGSTENINNYLRDKDIWFASIENLI